MMLSSKITRRLGAYFILALTVFALIVGVVFTVLFQRQSIDAHRDEITRYARSLAGVLSSNASSGSSAVGMMGQGMGGYGAYVRFIGEVSDTDIWIVDSKGQLTSSIMSHMMMNGQVNATTLSATATALLPRVLQGTTVSEDEKSGLLDKPAIVVGVPINKGAGVSGAVLMRSNVDGVNASVTRSLALLGLSMLIALLAALLLTVPLSYSFTRPLSRMKDTALALADSDFGARVDLAQNDEIGELARTLDVLAERLDEASQESAQLDAMRRDFIVNISHELRTPVTVMRGSLEALSEGVVKEPQKVEEYHQEMLAEAKHLERLVNDLLELSRLQNTHFSIEMAPVNMGDVAHDALRSAERLARERGVTLDVELGALPTIEGDYGRLRQMLLVIVDNALKFTPRGSFVVVRGQGSVLSIEDRGPGIDEQELPYIFERFYKTRSAENMSGTGLGLAIAREIAQRHSIEIVAANGPHGGALFEFVFPHG